MPAKFDSDSSLEREYHSPTNMGSKGGTPANRGRRGRSAGPVPTQSGDSGHRKRRLETDDESSKKESSEENSEESSEESMSRPPAKKPRGNAKSPRKQ